MKQTPGPIAPLNLQPDFLVERAIGGFEPGVKRSGPPKILGIEAVKGLNALAQTIWIFQ
jgi:hypothetical protein